MNPKIRTRLERLEENDRTHRMGVLEQVGREALTAASIADLDTMLGFYQRGGTPGDYTPEEKAVLERFTAEREAAALRMFGRPFSKLAATTH